MMKKNLLALLLALAMVLSLAACGGSDDAAADVDTSAEVTVEEDVYEEEEEEVEAANPYEAIADELFAVLPALVWIDEEGTTYAFGDETVLMTSAAGEAVEAYYHVSYDDEYAYLDLEAGDTYIENVVSAANDNSVTFTNTETGEETILADAEVVVGMMMDDAATELFTLLASTTWIDDELSTYGFAEDGSMVSMAATGEYVEGTYAIVYEDGTFYLELSIPDFGYLSYNQVMAMDETSIYFIDVDTGVETTLTPSDVVLDALAAATDLSATAEEFYAGLISFVWADDDGSAYGFGTDGSLEFASPDGTIYYGAYGVDYDESYLYLSISLADLGYEDTNVITLTDAGFTMTSLAYGTDTPMVPVG